MIIGSMFGVLPSRVGEYQRLLKVLLAGFQSLFTLQLHSKTQNIQASHSTGYIPILDSTPSHEELPRQVKLDSEGKPRPARLWTSSLKRTRLTARHIRRMACHRVVRQVRVEGWLLGGRGVRWIQSK